MTTLDYAGYKAHRAFAHLLDTNAPAGRGPDWTTRLYIAPGQTPDGDDAYIIYEITNGDPNVLGYIECDSVEPYGDASTLWPAAYQFGDPVERSVLISNSYGGIQAVADMVEAKLAELDIHCNGIALSEYEGAMTYLDGETRHQLTTLATDSEDDLAELNGASAIASRNNSKELIVAIWHTGSSTDGEADEYITVNGEA